MQFDLLLIEDTECTDTMSLDFWEYWYNCLLSAIFTSFFEILFLTITINEEKRKLYLYNRQMRHNIVVWCLGMWVSSMFFFPEQTLLWYPALCFLSSRNLYCQRPLWLWSSQLLLLRLQCTFGPLLIAFISLTLMPRHKKKFWTINTCTYI